MFGKVDQLRKVLSSHVETSLRTLDFHINVNQEWPKLEGYQTTVEVAVSLSNSLTHGGNK